MLHASASCVAADAWVRVSRFGQEAYPRNSWVIRVGTHKYALTEAYMPLVHILVNPFLGAHPQFAMSPSIVMANCFSISADSSDVAGIFQETR